MLKNDFESMNLSIFEEVFNNFGRWHDLVKSVHFQYVHTWFDAQFDQQILDSLYYVYVSTESAVRHLA